MLGARGLWAERDLYRATPAVTRGLGFSSLIQRTVPFSHLLRHARGCWWPILAHILTHLSSPELRAQVSFSDRMWSVGLLDFCSDYSRTALPNCNQNHPQVKEIQNCSIKGQPLSPLGDNRTKFSSMGKLIIYCFTSRSRFFTYHSRWRAAKFRLMLGAQGLWAGRDLYRATPAVTWYLYFSGLIRRIQPPHSVASYDTQLNLRHF
jgi:hypothetical protein